MQFEDIEVSTYSGYKADERPTAFSWREHEYRVVAVIDRWYEGGRQPGKPALSYFKVRVEDGVEYILRYNSLFDGWAIVVRDNAAQ